MADERKNADSLYPSRLHEATTIRPGRGQLSKAEFCSQHAKAGMIDVYRKKCAHQGCMHHKAVIRCRQWQPAKLLNSAPDLPRLEW